MEFKDNDHSDYYEEFIKRDKTNPRDPERKALFYLLALNDNCRSNINRLYDFKNHQIKFEGLSSSFQTSGSLAITKLAFNLYNNFNGETGDYTYKYMTPLDIFSSVDRDDMIYLWEAINIRLN